ncbi:membrane protein insertase YidC [Gallaecimonas kandeliae]|uniref:membrane protein insertase YidC n=1 Tax=Gallaecimonas kandeliae TaxID=3029055 RepID=UPI00264A10BD|nr:membrane protein insertase YidC [Gallaecimonas kandeliae]WKE65678.1 membrane protein insertase YidC [Gallaecimonas kandeliae]
MESQRSLLFFGLLAVSYLLFSAWQDDKAPKPAPAAVTQSVPAGDATLPASNDLPQAAQSQANQAQLISFGNDVLSLSVDTRGGDIVSAKLDKFAKELGGEERFALLTREPGFDYVAMSGLIGTDGSDTKGRPVYSAKGPVALADGSQQLELDYSANGVSYKKFLTLAPGKYVVNTRFEVQNGTDKPLSVQLFGQLKRTNHEPEGHMVAHSYTGAVYSTDDESYEKYSFDKIKEHDLAKETGTGWVAMLQHYFVSAWAPKMDGTKLDVYSLQSGDQAIIGIKSQPVAVAAHGEASLSADLYVGPKDQDALAQAAPKLEKTVDYGFLWFISEFLFWLLKLLHGVVHNWGFAIILLTLLVRGAMFPLTKAQFTSMAKMRNLQPKIAALKERFGDDRQRMSQGMMELYKKEGVNPLGGCFPLLLQMPIFMALYYVLQESVELRQAPFMLWIHDLSTKDPFFVLPLLFVASMWFSQRLNPSTITDPMQQKVMQFMPIMMGVFFAFFPAGLVLYWTVSNLVSITQQLIIYKGLEKKGLK